jgi:hypothetical protein
VILEDLKILPFLFIKLNKKKIKNLKNEKKKGG